MKHNDLIKQYEYAIIRTVLIMLLKFVTEFNIFN